MHEIQSTWANICSGHWYARTPTHTQVRQRTPSMLVCVTMQFLISIENSSTPIPVFKLYFLSYILHCKIISFFLFHMCVPFFCFLLCPRRLQMEWEEDYGIRDGNKVSVHQQFCCFSEKHFQYRNGTTKIVFFVFNLLQSRNWIFRQQGGHRYSLISQWSVDGRGTLWLFDLTFNQLLNKKPNSIDTAYRYMWTRHAEKSNGKMFAAIAKKQTFQRHGSQWCLCRTGH